MVVAGQEGKILPTVDPLKDIDRPLGPAEGEGHLMKRPIDVCSNQQGGLLVLDTEVCRIQHFASPNDRAETVLPRGAAQRTVHAPESIKYPRAMLQRPNGDLVICDTWSHRVLCYPADGTAPELLAGKPNSAGTGPELLNFPSGIAFDDSGALYVTDTNNHRIQRFLPGQKTATTIAGSILGQPGAGKGELNMPTGISIDPRDGSILVTDRMNARVLRFPSGGGQHGEQIIGAEHLLRPWGICQEHDGTIYVSDERRAVVLKIEAPASLSGVHEKAVKSETPAIEFTKHEAQNASQDPMQLD
jgi:hypothetical protein